MEMEGDEEELHFETSKGVKASLSGGFAFLVLGNFHAEQRPWASMHKGKCTRKRR